ncbi:PHOsphatase [Clonorchis sinensis]|uniref:Multiple inositol polyphosphate phosphatase 1 n=1 Tax=Clonorchis sinensis TaxID=79923 RepID=A0A3R7FR78_CLOSI|nr:PHOsphatase [Clonorchis sinensis]
MSISRPLLILLLGVTCMEILDPNEHEKIDPSGFATKTAYRHCGLSSFDDGTLKRLDSCTLVHINAIYRHGTRAPSSKDVRRIIELRDRLISSQGAILPSGFHDYLVPFEKGTDKALLPRGFEELYSFGRQVRNNNPTWFRRRPNITFYTSSSSRAVLSARSFYHGLFNLTPITAVDAQGIERHLNSIPEGIQTVDNLLRFFQYCKQYQKEIRKNKTALVEYWKFMNGAVMKGVLDEVVSKHHLPKADFSPADVNVMFLICGYEVAALSNDQSPWCGFLRAHHQLVMEYLLDLKQYWTKSYGFKLNYIHSCPLIAEIFLQIREAALNYKRSNYNLSYPNLHRASFWFGHAETLLPVIAALGLFNDSVGHDHILRLYADGFENWLGKIRAHPPTHTMFRTGHIVPFGGNLVLELYHCADAVSSLSSDPLAGFFVLPRVNDHTIVWPLASPVQPPTAESPGAPFALLSTVLRHLETCMPNVYNDSKHCALR